MIKILFLVFLSFPVLAIEPTPSMSVTRAGAVTTYKVLSTGGAYTPPATAPTGSGIVPLSSTSSVEGAKYVQNLNIPVGETIAAVKVSSGFSNTALATGIIALLRNPTLLNVAFVGGSALLSYLQSQNITSEAGVIKQSLPDLMNGYGQTSQGQTCSAYYGSDPWFAQNGYVCEFKSKQECYYTGPVENSINGSILLHQTAQGCGYNRNYPFSDSVIPVKTATAGSPITDLQAKNSILATPPLDAVKPAIVKQLFDALPIYSPISDSAPTLTAPSSVTSPSRSTVGQDGSVQTATDVTSFSSPSADTLSSTTTTTTSTTSPAGVTTTQTTTNAPPIPSTTTDTATQNKTDCELFPSSLGCAEFGTVPLPDQLPITNVPISLDIGTFDTGFCPAPQVLHLSTGDLSMSNQPLCDLASNTKPLFIALAFLSAGLLVLAPIRS